MLRRAAWMLFLGLSILCSAAMATRSDAGDAWSAVRDLGSTPNGGGASIAASGSNVYVAWGNGPTFIRRSTDDGATFSKPQTLSRNGDIHETDSLAAEGSNVFAVTFARTGWARDWCCARDLGDLVLHRSTDAGASWLPPVPLTSTGTAFRLSIAVSLPYVHVVWSDFRGDRWAIYYRRSTDGGATWEPERQIVAPGLEETNRPQIAALGKAVDLVWMDNRDGNGPCYTIPHCTETYTMRSLDAGASWSAPRRLTFNAPVKALLSGRGDIGVFGDGAVFIAYDQDEKFGKSSIQYGLYSPDGGQTWAAPMRLGGGNAEETHGAVATLGKDGAAAWFDRRFGPNTAEIYVRLSEDSGRTWQPEERVSFTAAESSTPHVAFTPGWLHLIWLEHRNDGGWDILYRRRAVPK